MKTSYENFSYLTSASKNAFKNHYEIFYNARYFAIIVLQWVFLDVYQFYGFKGYSWLATHRDFFRKGPKYNFLIKDFFDAVHRVPNFLTKFSIYDLHFYQFIYWNNLVIFDIA